MTETSLSATPAFSSSMLPSSPLWTARSDGGEVKFSGPGGSFAAQAAGRGYDRLEPHFRRLGTAKAFAPEGWHARIPESGEHLPGAVAGGRLPGLVGDNIQFIEIVGPRMRVTLTFRGRGCPPYSLFEQMLEELFNPWPAEAKEGENHEEQEDRVQHRGNGDELRQGSVPEGSELQGRPPAEREDELEGSGEVEAPAQGLVPNWQDGLRNLVDKLRG